MFKLRTIGVNACFGLNIQINVGCGIITGVATGTAVSLITIMSDNIFILNNNENN